MGRRDSAILRPIKIISNRGWAVAMPRWRKEPGPGAKIAADHKRFPGRCAGCAFLLLPWSGLRHGTCPLGPRRSPKTLSRDALAVGLVFLPARITTWRPVSQFHPSTRPGSTSHLAPEWHQNPLAVQLEINPHLHRLLPPSDIRPSVELPAADASTPTHLPGASPRC